LQYFNASSCKRLQRLPESISSLTSLSGLYVSMEHNMQLPESISKWTQLEIVPYEPYIVHDDSVADHAVDY
jgi:Leucine-rich repeat (LRR) protein